MKFQNNRRHFIQTAALAGFAASLSAKALAEFYTPEKQPGNQLPVLESGMAGMIGLDTSHCEAFTKVLNDPNAPPDLLGFPVVAAYPHGSKTIESSYKRIPAITEAMKKLGVAIVGSIDELLEQVDVVLLETNDGRLHYEQALKVIKAGKRLFIDKPVASNLADAIAIFAAAKKYNVPVFSCSSLRFAPAVQEILKGNAIGKITGADTYTPCPIEKTHGDLFWYGIHGVETLYTLLGKGCRQVVRVYKDDTDLVAGTWNDGRIGSFRGLRSGKEEYGATVFGDKGIQHITEFGGYVPLLKEIVTFFRSGVPPVSAEETIEICAFMEAADESKKSGGTPVAIQTMMKKVKRRANK